MSLRNLDNFNRKLVIAGFLLFLILSNENLSAQEDWYLNSSLQYSKGNYFFNPNSKYLAINSGLRYQSENFGISVAVPFSSNNNGDSAVVDAANQMQGNMNWGLGDIYTYIDYKIYSDIYNDIDIYLNAQIKIPTAASHLNIGTGEFDFGGSLSVRKTFDSYLAVVDLGYLNIGDPDGIVYKNPFTYGIGIGKFFNYGEYSLLLYYYGFTKIADDYDAPKQISVGANYKANDNLILSAIVSAGIGNLTPEFTLSGGIRIKL